MSRSFSCRQNTRLPNKGLHQTGRGGVAHFVSRGPVVEARPAGEARCCTGVRGQRPSKGGTFRSWLALSLLLLAVRGGAAELRPTLSAGFADIVGEHGSLSAALRVQIASAFFVQAEYLVLQGDRHTDRGPTVLVGFSGPKKDRFRPFLGLGGGPVKGYRGDDGMLYLAVGATQPVGQSRRAFLQAEFRTGLLGESGYRQFTIGIGVSR